MDPQINNTILAALRFYQENGQGEPRNRSDEIHKIASNDDNDISLDADGIDELCQKLNLNDIIVLDSTLWVKVVDALDERIQTADYLAPETFDDEEHENNHNDTARVARAVAQEAKTATPELFSTRLKSLTGKELPETPAKPSKVTCKFCKKKVPAETAHRHQRSWVGDDCCWDERLRSSE